MSFQSFGTDFQLDIVENGKSILTTQCTASFYDSDILDCAEIDIETENKIDDDELSDAVHECLHDFLKSKSAKEWDGLHGEVIQINYDRANETATVEK